MLVKVYETGARAWLDTGAVTNVLSCNLKIRLGLDAEQTTRSMTVATGAKYYVVGVLGELPLILDQKKVKLDFFLVVDGLQYVVIIGDPSMEELKVVLDLDGRIASFVIDGEAV